ncbi:MAG: DNA-directed RNA polymerase [Candidatus Micrarchaeia archaeon]|jgi:DNA-directed RNA polymerase subunit E'
MFYINEIEDKVRVTPEFFKEKPKEAITRILREEYERRVYRDLGVIIVVFDTVVEGDGLVIPGDASAYYDVKFKALTFMPYVNEVYETEIKDVVDFGAFCLLGPLQGLTHISQIGQDKFLFNKKLKKLSSKNGKRSIKKGDKGLVKISTVSLKSNISETKIGLTMRSPGLGKLEWIEEENEKKPKKAKEKPKGEKK